MSKVNTENKKSNAIGAFLEQYSFLMGIVLIIIAWPVMTICLKPFIERLGDLSLFIYNTEFFNQKVFAPAGMLDYICSFLNQLLFTPWSATLLLTALFAAAYMATVRLFELKGINSLLALIPIALLICTVTGYGHNIYFIKNQNLFFTSTIGFLFALCTAACINKCNKSLVCKLIATVLAGTAGYLIAGAYALLGLAITAVMSIADKNAQIAGKDAQIADRLAVAGCAILVILVFPLFFCKQYTAGIEFVNFTTYNSCNTVPFILLSLFTVALTFAKQTNNSKPILELCCTLAATLLAIIIFNGIDKQFATELKMFRALENENYQEVLNLYDNYADKCNATNKKEYSKLKNEFSGKQREERINILSEYYRLTYKSPSRTMSQFRLIALGRTGQIGTKLFASMTGEIDRDSKLSYSTMLYEYGPTFFNNWGVFSSAYIWASGNSIHSGWNYYNLKEAVVALMLKGDNELAGKYIDILCATKIYRKWAEEQKQYMQNGTADKNSKYNYMLALNCPRKDQYISSSNNMEQFLMNHFSVWDNQPGTNNITKEYAEYAMLWAMYSQNIQTFWKALNSYIIANKSTELPRFYQEAVYLYSSIEQQSELLKIIEIDKDVVQKHNEFRRFITRNQNLHMFEMRDACYRQFGSTFYYFYYFTKNFI